MKNDRRRGARPRGPDRRSSKPDSRQYPSGGPARPRRDDEHPRAGGQTPHGAQHRGAHERDLVFGVEPVRELVAAAPGAIRSLHLRAGDERRFAAEIERVRAAGGRIERADDAALDRLAGADVRHQGIVALVREYSYAPLEEILAQKPDPVVLVDGVTDPRNLGALLRSAEGAGVSAVVLARDRTAAITPAAIKSSAGAWVHLRIARCGNVARALEELKRAGYWVVALAPGGTISLYDLDVARRLVVVIGSEGRGVREIVKKTADFLVDIPMRGKVASLNVSVAAAVALFEVARKRAASRPPGASAGT
jgi:23S rRNA (guanosine2251-2'-O)-methyltransferase